MHDLLILVTEAGSAAFLRPVLRRLQECEGLDWCMVTTPVALRAVADFVPAARVLRGDMERNSIDGVGDIMRIADPRVVLSSAGGWPLERECIRLAQQKSRQTAQFVDTWYGYRRRLLEGENAVLPDHLLMIDSRAKAEAEIEGLPAERILLCGHPLWSEIRQLPSSDSRATLFLGAPVLRDYGNTLGYTEDDAWECLLRVARERPDLVSNLQYAPHPEQRDISVSVPTSLYSTANLSAIGQVIGMFSAPLIEAYLAGRRSISLQPHANDIDMAPLSRFGLSPRVTDADQLITALQATLPDNTVLRADLAHGTARFISAIEDLLAA